MQLFRIDFIDFRSKNFAKRAIDVGIHLCRVLCFYEVLVVMNDFDFEAGLVLTAAHR